MGLFGNGRRLKAVSGSMPQFIPVIRSLFNVRVPDEDIEAILVFLYMRAAQDAFGRDFARRLGPRLRQRLKYCSIDRLDECTRLIEETVRAYDEAPDDLLPEGATQSQHEHHMRSLVRTLLLTSGQAADDAELVRDSYATVERTLLRLAEHMAGIRRQNHFLLSR